MFKWIARLFVLAAALLIAAVLLRNTIGTWIAEAAFERLTGFSVTIGQLDIKLNKPLLIARNITVRNPKTVFKERRAMTIHLMEADYDPVSFFRSEPHFQRLVIDIAEVVAVRNADGEVNLKRLQRPAPSKDPAKPQRGFKIDELALSVAEALYLDERQSDPAPRRYAIHARNRIYKNITNPEDIKKLVVNLVIRSLPGNLLGLGLQNVGKAVQGDGSLIDKVGQSILNFFGTDGDASETIPPNK